MPPCCFAGSFPSRSPRGRYPIVTTKPKPFDGLMTSSWTCPWAPDPLACEQDSDCVFAPVVTQDGCCVAMPLTPQSRSWHSWVRQRRSTEACERVRCEPLPPPTVRECSTQVHFSEGRCRDSCSVVDRRERRRVGGVEDYVPLGQKVARRRTSVAPRVNTSIGVFGGQVQQVPTVPVFV